MPLQFSPQPGAHERRLRRLHNNPLFSAEKRDFNQLQVAEAQSRDQQELRQFISEFETLVQEAVHLDANVEADVVLNLKERLDMAYERCSGLAGDPSDFKTAIERLLAVIMRAVRQHAGDDATAQQKLELEEQARAAHFSLQAYPIVADLLRTDPVILEDELVPSLLSESSESLAAAVRLFDTDQLTLITQQARVLLEQCSQQGSAPQEAKHRLTEIEAHSAQQSSQGPIN